MGTKYFTDMGADVTAYVVSLEAQVKRFEAEADVKPKLNEPVVRAVAKKGAK